MRIMGVISIFCITMLLAACATVPSNNSSFASKISSAKESITHGNFENAYKLIEQMFYNIDLFSDEHTEIIELFSQYPKLNEAGDKHIASYLQSEARNHANYASFKEATDDKIKNYKSLVSSNMSSRIEVLSIEIFEKHKKISTPYLPPLNEVQGRPFDEFKRRVDAKPSSVVKKVNPYNVNTQYFIYLYNIKKSRSYNDENNYPVWVTVFNNNLVDYGIGHANEAELKLYTHYINSILATKKINHETAERALRDKYYELYSDPGPIMAEFFAYKILLGGRIDSGTISLAEAEYLLTQKRNELIARLNAAYAEIQKRKDELRLQELQTQAQREAEEHARRMMLLQHGLQILYPQKPQGYRIYRPGELPWTVAPY